MTIPESPSQPQNWFTPMRPLTTAKLAPDEQLRMIVHNSMPTKDNPTKLLHNLLTIIQKGNKAIARHILIHSTEDTFCNGHADDTAEYAITDLTLLCEDIKNMGIIYTQHLLENADRLGLSANNMEPIIVLMIPPEHTNNQQILQILQQIAQQSQTNTADSLQIIARILGLDSSNALPLPESAQTFPQSLPQSLPQTIPSPNTTDLIKQIKHSQNTLMQQLISEGNIEKIEQVKTLLSAYERRYVLTQITKNKQKTTVETPNKH